MHPQRQHGSGPEPNWHARPRLIVLATSAGGLASLSEVLAPLPSNFPTAIAIVQHRGPDNPEQLVELLRKRTRLRVCNAQDGMPLEAGTVYICPPGLHMTAEHSVRLVDGPRIEYVRPSADLMFESVARTYGHRALGVVLSGMGRDAALGSLALAQAGAQVIAQDPKTCFGFSGMPETALSTGAVERVLAPAEIARALCAWAEQGSFVPATDSSAQATQTKVLLVDDHRIVLDGLHVLLEGQSDMMVVGRAEDGRQAVQVAAELRPDVVVMDIRMPGLDGVNATREIVAHTPHTRVVALSSDTNVQSVNGILKAGATGYLTKQRAFGELAQAIRDVMKGKVYVSREIAELVTRGLVKLPLDAPGAVQ
jgi:two-component system chemotaxis response regulator CheB